MSGDVIDATLTRDVVLLEAPHRKGHNNNSVLLCVDLTKGVADEAIRRKDAVVMAYRKFCYHTVPHRLISSIYIYFASLFYRSINTAIQIQ